MGIFHKKSQLEKKYKVDPPVLGTGNFAQVKKCMRLEDKKEFAVKIIDKSKVEDMQDIEREIEIMGKVDHPNVIKLVDVFDETKKMNLVLELVTGGELFDKIVEKGNYTEKDAANTLMTLCDALEHLHAKGVVHRDLKPENILLASKGDNAPIKVADFGLARVMKKGDVMKTACGTPGYVAPEILMGHGYGKEVDLWALGVITYILLCGFPPFYDDSQSELFNTIRKGKYHYPSPYWDEVSSDARNVIDNLLKLDPRVRWTAEQVLENPWVASEAGDKHLAHFKENMTRYNARRKFRAGIMSLQVLNFMAKGGGVSLADMVEKSAAIAAGDPPAEAK